MMFLRKKHRKQVSIPYRLATNIHACEREFPLCAVSIPYRLATNVKIMGEVEIAIAKFQFLIGWLQTLDELVSSLISAFCFNSL